MTNDNKWNWNYKFLEWRDQVVRNHLTGMFPNGAVQALLFHTLQKP
ncbi:14665_t:CDS:2 [Rhizophagus irregularis]|nr:14665_t:CDS:2 [Rhizophagus irregularis]